MYNAISWTDNDFSTVNAEKYNKKQFEYISGAAKSYDQLFDPGWGYNGDGYREGFDGMYYAKPSTITAYNINLPPPPPPSPNGNMNKKLRSKVDFREHDGDGVADEVDIKTGDTIGQKNDPKGQSPNVQIRKNFNETAFFFPDLKTDENGEVSFSFTIPEALTKWKLMTFAHTKDLASAYLEKTTITQKPLMVQPNAPRFMREGDRMEFSTKIVNLGDSEVTGTAQLELMDAITGKPVDGWFKNMFSTQYFTAAAGQSTALKFPMEIPFNFNAPLTYRIKAFTKANSKGEVFSDGEEMALPVLTNRMLITESLPLNLRNKTTKNFRFEKLLNSKNSVTLSNHALTVEYTSNPAWYAVQARSEERRVGKEC